MPFPNPVAAMDALIACINPPRGTVIHRGSAASGLTLPCCSGHPVMRVETGPTLPAKGEPRQVLDPGINCGAVSQQLVVSWRECFNTNTGKTALPAETLTEMGLNVVLGWWSVMMKVACCDGGKQFWFVSRQDFEPEVCAGWDMTFECLVGFCAPCPS